MPQVILGEADRQRLGCPESLPFDLRSITNREAIELRRLGFNTPRLFRVALAPKTVPVLDGDQPLLGDDGAPVEDVVVDYQAWTALIWLALRRAGIVTDPATLEFDLSEFNYVADPEPEQQANEGKAEAPEA